MAVITFSLSDFYTLLGKEIPLQELEDILTMMGVPVENTNDDEIEVEIFPNRPDLLSVEGLARAVRSFTGIEPGLKRYNLGDSGVKIFVEESTKRIRPYIVCAVARHVVFNDKSIASIMQIQEKLHATIGRKRRKAAIGIYDFDTIKPPIVYKALEPNMIEFVPLGDANVEYGYMSGREILIKHPKGREYAYILEPLDKYPLLVDSSSLVLSMPPIINSENTKVSESTKHLFIDITGTDMKTIKQILNIIVTMLAERGAKIETTTVIYPDGKKIVVPDFTPAKLELKTDYTKKLLGISIDAEHQAKILKKMGYGINSIGSRDNTAIISVSVPAYRTDIMHMIDLVEDIAIGYGYDRFDKTIPAVATVGKPLKIEEYCEKTREILIGAGFSEVMNFIISNKEKLLKGLRRDESIKLAEIDNYNSPDYTTLRDTLIISILDTFSVNKLNPYPQKIFEIGDTVVPDSSEETGAKTRRKLCIGISNQQATFSDIKSVFVSLFSNLGIKDVRYCEGFYPAFIKGRCAYIYINDKSVGVMGEIHPEVLTNIGLDMPVALGEIDIEGILLWSERG